MENMRNNLQSAIDDMLDQKVPKTDMKLRHIVSKGFEVGDSLHKQMKAGLLCLLPKASIIKKIPLTPETIIDY